MSDIRTDELRRWSAELMQPGIAGLFLHGVAGIGKSVLAAQIADRISSEHPQTQVTTVTGAVTVEQLVAILVADSPSVVVLDQFEANVADGTMGDRGLAAVLVCLAEAIADRDDEGRRARVIVTARQPLALSPHIPPRQVCPLTRWSANEFARSLPRLRELTSAEREYAWRLTAGNPGCLRAFDARLADARFAELADSLAGVIAARIGLPVCDVFPPGLDPSAAAAIASAAESVLSRPRAATRAAAAQYRPAEPAEGTRRRRHKRLVIVSAALVTAVIAWALFAVKPLVTSSAPASVAVPAARPASHRTRPAPAAQSPEVADVPARAAATTPEAAAASWLAGNVTGGTLIGCDPAMCSSLSRQGLPRADLSPLHPGSNLAADSLIVATPQARAQMGSTIAAAAPELTASFGTGSGQVEVWEVTAGGAAAYSSLLAADMASRREGGNLILGNTNIKASGDTWAVLCSGHADSRILLALAEVAHSVPLTIVSFGAANPGAAAEVPVRSVLIDVADPAAAAASLKVQDPAMQPLAVRIGSASLWVEFGAPSPLGLFQAES